MKRQKRKDSVALEIQSLLVRSYVFIMLFIFPLFFLNQYFGIMRAKRNFYLWVTGVFIIFSLFIWLSIQIKDKRIDLKDKWILLFMGIEVGGLLGTFIVNNNKYDVFWGNSGRYLGCIAIGFGIITVLLIGRNLQWTTYLSWAFLLGSGGVHLLQLLNEFQIDPFGMSVGVYEGQREYFISTIGNINFNATFDSITIPILMVLFFLSKEKTSRRIYFTFVCLGYAGMICCRSDSIYVVIVAAFAVLFMFGVYDTDGLKRYLYLIEAFLGIQIIIGMAYKIWNNKAYTFRGIGGKIFDKEILFVLGIILLAVFLLNILWVNKFSIQIIRKMFGTVLICLGIVAAIVILCINYLGEIPMEDNWKYQLYFNDAWGNNRGYIWKRVWQVYEGFGPLKKLFGCGMDNCAATLQSVYGEEMQQLFGATRFSDAHNEFLQYLISTGIVGIVGYYGTQITLLISCIKQYRKKDMCLIGIVGIITFSVQGIVNNPTIITTPLYFIELGIIFSIVYGFAKKD